LIIRFSNKFQESDISFTNQYYNLVLIFVLLISRLY
jgi:hypothetical protein